MVGIIECVMRAHKKEKKKTQHVCVFISMTCLVLKNSSKVFVSCFQRLKCQIACFLRQEPSVLQDHVTESQADY